MDNDDAKVPLLYEENLSGDESRQNGHLHDAGLMQRNDEDIREVYSTPTASVPCFVYSLTVLSAIGGFLFGYDTGVVSGAMIFLRDEFHLNAVWQELVVSVTIGAAAIFAFVGGHLNNWCGRKPTILLASLIFTAGALLLALAVNTVMLLIGRIIVGVGIGLASMTIPMYIAECAPSNVRGRLVTVNILFITGGQFIASIVDGIFSFDKKNGWRYMLGLAGIPSAIQFIGFLFMPESPRWLVQKGHDARALEVLRRIRSRQDVHSEFTEVQDSCNQASDSQVDAVLLRILRTPHVLKALIVGCGLQLFQQICGINTVMYYSATIIKMSGVRDASKAVWLATLPAGTNFLFTFVGLYLVERIGRRPLTIGSLAGTLVSVIIMAVGFQLAAIRAPPVTFPSPGYNGSSHCQLYSNCNPCMEDTSCGFCYIDLPSGVANGSCAPVAHNPNGDVNATGAAVGRCSVFNPSTADTHSDSRTGAVWAYDFCPTDVSWMSLVSLVLYLATFAPGMGPMPWTINSEIYPLWARSTAISIATTFNWSFNLIISMTFLSLTQALTRYGAFWLYSGFCLMGLLFMAFLLPETKGRSLEQVEDLFKRPWFSKRS